MTLSDWEKRRLRSHPPEPTSQPIADRYVSNASRNAPSFARASTTVGLLRQNSGATLFLSTVNVAPKMLVMVWR